MITLIWQGTWWYWCHIVFWCSRVFDDIPVAENLKHVTFEDIHGIVIDWWWCCCCRRRCRHCRCIYAICAWFTRTVPCSALLNSYEIYSYRGSQIMCRIRILNKRINGTLPWYWYGYHTNITKQPTFMKSTSTKHGCSYNEIMVITVITTGIVIRYLKFSILPLIRRPLPSDVRLGYYQWLRHCEASEASTNERWNVSTISYLVPSTDCWKPSPFIWHG